MKQILAVFPLLLLFVTFSTAGPIGDNILSGMPDGDNTSVESYLQGFTWADYHAVNAEAHAAMKAGKYKSSAKSFQAAFLITSVALQRKDVSDWAINNVAYSKIKDFKSLTNYDVIMREIEATQPSEDKITLIKNTALLLGAHLGLIAEARDILTLNKITNPSVIGISKSNLDFCIWVINWIETNKSQ